MRKSWSILLFFPLLSYFPNVVHADDKPEGTVKVAPYARLIGDLEAIRIHNIDAPKYEGPGYIRGDVFELEGFQRLSRAEQERYLIYKFGKSRFDGEKAFFLRGLIEAYKKQHPNEDLSRRMAVVDRDWLKTYLQSIGGSIGRFDENMKSFTTAP